MKLFVLSLVLVAAAALAQDAIPPGTILPVQLDSTINASKAHPGQAITARIMQDVPLPGKARIRANSKVIGHVVAVTPASASSVAQLTLSFDSVVQGKRRILVVTKLRALANMMDVADAQIPMSGADRGTSEADWVTEQVGGDINYHGTYVTNGSTVVGQSMLGNGALVRVRSGPGEKCRAEIDGSDLMQALWVFSSDACGLFGYPDMKIVHAGRSNPVGQITLKALKGNLVIRGGSGLLLRVDGF
ncbi:MAG: hypothetical protein WAN03_16795 [Candidatus Sulfotelmatobacter sp.]